MIYILITNEDFLIGAGVTEPHTSELNFWVEFINILLSVVHIPFNATTHHVRTVSNIYALDYFPAWAAWAKTTRRDTWEKQLEHEDELYEGCKIWRQTCLLTECRRWLIVEWWRCIYHVVRLFDASPICVRTMQHNQVVCSEISRRPELIPC